MAYKGTVLVFSALLSCVVASPSLTARQSDDYKCDVNTTYHAPIGLDFDVYPCTVNQGAGDTIKEFVTDTAEECMNVSFAPTENELRSSACAPVQIDYLVPYATNCTEVGGDGSACVAMVWGTGDHKCWLVNNSMTVNDLVYSNTSHTAFVSDLSLFMNRDVSCTNGDKNAPNNLTFQVFCGQDVDRGNHITPWTAVNGTTDHHSDTLEDCMEFCSTMRPKCYGVTYNPGLTGGYVNCYPKGADATTNKFTTIADTQVALAQFSSDFNTSCSQGNYTAAAADKAMFSMTCDATAGGRNISTVYAASFGSCMDICATYSQSSSFCNAVNYQPDGADGYENCYLLADGQANGTRSEWRMALRTDDTGRPVDASSGTSSTGSSGGGSKAWIAGPVIGAVAAVAILLGAWFWWRKRQSKNKGTRERHLLDGKPRWRKPSELDGNFTERKELNAQQQAPSAELPGDDAWRDR